MSDKKISQLTAASTPLTGTEELAIVQSGSTVKATAQDIADLAGGVPYKSYVANISQSGTNNPSVTVLENTFTSPISVTRNSVGSYTISCSEFNFFLGNKTTIEAIATNQSMRAYTIRPVNPTNVQLLTYSGFGPGDFADDLLNNTKIEFRLYP